MNTQNQTQKKQDKGCFGFLHKNKVQKKQVKQKQKQRSKSSSSSSSSKSGKEKEPKVIIPIEKDKPQMQQQKQHKETTGQKLEEVKQNISYTVNNTAIHVKQGIQNFKSNHSKSTPQQKQMLKMKHQAQQRRVNETHQKKLNAIKNENVH